MLVGFCQLTRGSRWVSECSLLLLSRLASPFVSVFFSLTPAAGYEDHRTGPPRGAQEPLQACGRCFLFVFERGGAYLFFEFV